MLISKCIKCRLSKKSNWFCNKDVTIVKVIKQSENKRAKPCYERGPNYYFQYLELQNKCRYWIPFKRKSTEVDKQIPFEKIFTFSFLGLGMFLWASNDFVTAANLFCSERIVSLTTWNKLQSSSRKTSVVPTLQANIDTSDMFIFTW